MAVTGFDRNGFPYDRVVALAREVHETTSNVADSFQFVKQLRESAIVCAASVKEASLQASRAMQIDFLLKAQSALVDLDVRVRIGVELDLISAGTELLSRIDDVGKLLQRVIQRRREQRSRDCLATSAHLRRADIVLAEQSR